MPAGASSRSNAHVSTDKRLSVWALVNMCVGLFGVQIVWALQNVNTSRIFQAHGAKLDELPILWIAGPITGLLLQPVIGYLSDRTWTPMGRRRPYILLGAIISAIALVLMPNVQSLWAASVMLWLLTGGMNIAMEPFRALVADLVPDRQQTTAYALQVAFIGAGAVFASALPWILANWFCRNASEVPGALPESLRVAYLIGAIGLIVTVGYSVFTTKEIERVASTKTQGRSVPKDPVSEHRKLIRAGLIWMLAGVALWVFTWLAKLRPELYILAGISTLLGAGHMAAAWFERQGKRQIGLLEIAEDVLRMPQVMRRLCLVQFCTWFALFTLWIYAVPAVANANGVLADASSRTYNYSADRVGVIFAFYNAVAAFGALILPVVVQRIGRRNTHAICLTVGAGGLIALGPLAALDLWWIPALAIGVAWASILSIPYAMVSSTVSPARVGVYMGIHNTFLVLPQLVAAALLGWIVSQLLSDSPGAAMLLAASAMLIAGGLCLTVPAEAEGHLRT